MTSALGFDEAAWRWLIETKAASESTGDIADDASIISVSREHHGLYVALGDPSATTGHYKKRNKHWHAPKGISQGERAKPLLIIVLASGGPWYSA